MLTVPPELHLEFTIAVVERMFKLARFVYLHPLFYHFVLRINCDYLAPKILFKSDRDLYAFDKWLVSHSPIEKKYSK